jgi:hypothetical protein
MKDVFYYASPYFELHIEPLENPLEVVDSMANRKMVERIVEDNATCNWPFKIILQREMVLRFIEWSFPINLFCVDVRTDDLGLEPLGKLTIAFDDVVAHLIYRRVSRYIGDRCY